MADVDYNENIRFHLDTLLCKSGVIIASGWLFSELPISKLYLIDDTSDDLRFEIKSYGLQSIDVVHHHGPIGANSRFFEKIRLPEDAVCQISALVVCFQSGLLRKISLLKIDHHVVSGISNDRPATLKLGIGITTYRRRVPLERLIDKLMLHTKTSFELIVADDGSDDDTITMLKTSRISHITGRNRGVAWNKNRALYYLNNRRKCDILILLEDDTFPSVDAWERDWIDATIKHGHINLAGHWFKDKFIDGKGSPSSPITCFSSSGQCVAFTRNVIDRVGFFDSRFGRYGYEHAEHSQRCIRLGFGGVYQPLSKDDYVYFLIRGGLTVGHLLESHGNDILENGIIYNSVRSDQIHRWAWRGDEEMTEFLKEQDLTVIF